MTRDSMRPGDSVSRRKFIVATGATGTATLAGCIGSSDGSGEETTEESMSDETDESDDESDQTSEGGDETLSGQVVITGSSTVFPVSDAMAERFMENNPEVNVTVDSTGSGGGFENHFCPGDALTVAVNNNADWVDSMTFDELSQIWRKDGAETWSDVRDDWPDEPLELFGPASTSGTYDWFNENVVGEEYDHTAQHEPTEEDNLIVQGIQDSEYAMGYFGYAYYNENSDSVKAVKIAAEEGDEPTEPSLANAKDGSYPMARPLFIYPSEEAIQRKPVYEFLSFYLEKAETDLVQEIGYVPSSVEMRDENLSKLDEIAGK
ncbi:phosphate ABC transporter substrate-binding protein [Halobacteriales archaeon SW_6_65_15]|nr:MAG: phosphate ABC transporter substrate-binding protein [Halobacteriales archaeon SW_6_65_15]